MLKEREKHIDNLMARIRNALAVNQWQGFGQKQ
jgi:hypothetical protein